MYDSSRFCLRKNVIENVYCICPSVSIQYNSANNVGNWNIAGLNFKTVTHMSYNQVEINN